MAMENGVNSADVQGSGKDGRILKDDIVRFLNNSNNNSNNILPVKKVQGGYCQTYYLKINYFY